MYSKKYPFLLSMLGLALGSITVIPQNFTVQHTSGGLPHGNLTILCRATSADIHGITFIQIRKQNIETKENIPLLSLSPEQNLGRPHREVGLDNREGKVSGVIRADSPMDSYLRLEFADASCLDEGTFICNIIFYRQGASDTEMLTDSANVSTITLPEKVLVLQTPAYDSFLVNQLVELRCSGQVGSPPAWFRWKWRFVGTDSSKETEFQPITFGVLHPEGPYPQGFCRHFRASTLYLRATKEVDRVEIRCAPVRGVTEYVDLSGSFIFDVKEAGCIPDCFHGGVCVGNTCHCKENFTGSFCEQRVTSAPCYTQSCQESNSGKGINSFFVLHPLLLTVLCMLLTHE